MRKKICTLCAAQIMSAFTVFSQGNPVITNIYTSDLALRNIPEGSEERKYIQWRRSVCVDELHYNEDGTIQQVIPTTAQ